jgi:hypothetical protein
MEIVYPMFAMFALTVFVLLRMLSLRYTAAKNEEINMRFFKSYRGYEEPEHLRVISRHVINLFEMPMLFYVVGILILQTAQTGVLTLSLAWAYVALRCIHSYIHLTSNKVMMRLRAFMASSLVLVALWLTVFIGLISAG